MARSRSPRSGRDIRRAQQSLRLPQRQPVPDADALRLGALHAADAGGQFWREQPVVRRLGSQLADRRHSNNDGRRTEAAVF